MTGHAGRVGVKICGLRRPADVDAARRAGAAWTGFVHFPRSPRHLSLPDLATLTHGVADGPGRVALLVDPDDGTVDALAASARLDMLQLHGAETPGRVAAIRDRAGLPVMKAVGIRDAADVDAAAAYEDAADWLLLDAKAPEGADRPGGNGEGFDWTLLRGRAWRRPWMLAGGLTEANVAQAVAVSGARAVDLSSGVESAPGVKDPARIASFCAAVHAIG